MQKNNTKDPIAIIGIGCRFPKANTATEFWQLLKNGKSGITEIPRDRFDKDEYYDARPGTPGKIMSCYGGFVDEIDKFDAVFFNMSPREAIRLDPQQRMLLEASWEALADAGQDVNHLKHSATGVYVGMATSDYEILLFSDPNRSDSYMITGSLRFTAGGRLSNFYGFNGPSFTVDTACSSSLIAAHLACQAIWNRECEMALVGGVNAILSPHMTIGFSQAKIMAPDGKCKFGDASANGYVRSEGAGAIVLKPLSKALADNDPVYALVLGSSTNNDGQLGDYFGRPAVGGHEDLLRKAYANANIDPKDVAFVEAHGTGTKAGDPVEITALANILGEHRLAERPLLLGSVKTNIGHSEGAAGIAGLIKAAMALKYRQLPPSLHFNTPNPNIAWDKSPVKINTGLTDLSNSGEPLIAGVNSFGMSGANAHIVLQEVNETARGEKSVKRKAWSVKGEEAKANSAFLLPLSAHSAEALKARAMSFRHFLNDAKEQEAIDLANICYTASARSTHLQYRAAIAGSDVSELLAGLDAFVKNEAHPNLANGVLLNEQQPKIAFVFPGQGSQWPGMAQQLFKTSAVFKESIMRCEKAIAKYADWSLTEQLMADENHSRLNEIDVIQPALFSIQVSLAKMWQQWGISPDAVAGHSMGEVAAAHIAGALSLDNAARIICRRSQLLKHISGKGLMASVELSLDEAAAAVQNYRDRISIAVSNNSRTTVLSGDAAALRELVEKLTNEDVYCKFIKVDVASHSPQMDPLLDELLQQIEGLQPQPCNIPTCSTVRGGMIDGEQLNEQYWADNLRQPVLFTTALHQLVEEDHTVFIEISPHPILLPAIREEFSESNREVIAIPSLHREEDERLSMLASFGRLYATGYPVDWRRLYPEGGQCIKLPPYPWQRERYWYTDEFPETALQNKKPVPLTPNTDGTNGKMDIANFLKENLYQIEWQLQPAAEKGEDRVASNGYWLLFADHLGVSSHLAEHFKTAGHQCILVKPGTKFERVNRNNYIVNPSDITDFIKLYDDAVKNSLAECEGIIHLWSLNKPKSNEPGLETIDKTIELSCFSLLYLLQVLRPDEREIMPRLWLVTNGVQQVVKSDQTISVAQAPFWGTSRVAANEYPGLKCTNIDLGATCTEAELNCLIETILANGEEDRIAIREADRYVASLKQYGNEPVKDTPLTDWQNGTYLITGGLGSLGILTAKWMTEQGANSLVLVGRSEASEQAKEALAEMKQSGAQIKTIQADITIEEDVERILGTIKQSSPALKGIVHAAGVLGDTTIRNMDRAKFKRVLDPKVKGAWLLHKHTSALSLDFFVMFSSISSTLGQAGQCNYAAGNAFLDSLAYYRKNIGLQATSINWGPWGEVGLAVSQAVRGERQASFGMLSFSPAQGIAALQYILRHSITRAAVMRFDVLKWCNSFPQAAQSPFFRMLLNASNNAATTASPPVPAVSLRQKLRDTQVEEKRREILVAFLQKQVAEVINLKNKTVPVDAPFRQLGLDSLMALEFKTRLESRLELKIRASVFFIHPTISSLANQLMSMLGNLPENSRTTETSQGEHSVKSNSLKKLAKFWKR